MTSRLSADLALRIGLAARVLPGVAVADVVQALIALLGFPLTDRKLRSLTVAQLRAAPGGVLLQVPRPQLREALAFLTDRASVNIIDTTIPPIQRYEDGDMPGSVRIAVASDSGLQLDGFFNTCLRFLVFQLSATETRLIDVRGTAAAKATDDGNRWRAECIADCHLLLTVGVGTSNVARLMRLGVHPLGYGSPMAAPWALDRIQEVLQGTPPPWLVKAGRLERPRPLVLHCGSSLQ
ncbi:MAG: dinitrogenase iron-molybdenum cofactor biosynthesis protein [Proteobacteria bacterium]|nr:dinitrogenase iron-molybdenum cofactor biosynthesis protein [Pseudomonadota bacterium]